MPKSIHVLIVGKQQHSVYDLMKSADVSALAYEGRLHVIDRYVDDITEQMVFAAADIVWLGYRSHFAMSGVLVLAAISGKVILASRNGLIGWYTREKRLGLTIDASNDSPVINPCFVIKHWPEKASAVIKIDDKVLSAGKKLREGFMRCHAGHLAKVILLEMMSEKPISIEISPAK